MQERQENAADSSNAAKNRKADRASHASIVGY
jgi:hypothetical protein